MIHSNKIFRSLWFALVAVACFAVAPVFSSEVIYSFGVVPQQSAIKTAKIWSPILSHLSKKTGYRFQLKASSSIPVFEKRLRNGEFDFAYMNPYHYVAFHNDPGYIAFAKAKNKRIKGIIVVKKDSAIINLKDLDGNTLAFPAPAAFAATILPRAYFRQAGIDITPKYVTSHDSVYLSVSHGLFPAGGGVIRTFKNIAPELRSQLRVLWKTKGYTPHAFATHPRVPQVVVQAVKSAVQKMDNIATGKTLLEKMKIKGIESAQNADWDDVRALNIHEL